MGTIVLWLVIAAGLLVGGGFLWRTSRSTGSEGFTVPSWARDLSWAGRAAGWSARNGATAGRNAAGWLARLVAWWKSRHGEPAAVPVPVDRSAPAPAPRRPAPAQLAAQVLDDAMAPGDGVGTGRLTPEWAAICAVVGSFEPADDEDYLRHLRDQATGFAAYADSVRAGADILAAETGLDPAVVHAHLEMADATGDCAHDVAMVGRRFCAVYAAVQGAIAEGLRLPFRAREFLTGAGG